MITGLAMGITILTGQKIGEKRPDEAGKAIGSGICLFAALAVCITAVMLLAANPLAVVMQAPEEAFSRTVTYVQICSAGTVFIAVSYTHLILQGREDTKRDVSEMFLKDNLVLLGNLPRKGSPLAILQCAK